MKIKAMLWDYRALQDGTYPIKIRVTVGSKVEYFPVNASATIKQWDAKAGRVKVDYRDNADVINDKIRTMLSSIESNYFKGLPLTATDASDDFYKHFQDKIDYTKSKHSHSHYKRLKTVLQKLKEYRPSVAVNEVNYDFVKGFERFLLARGNSTNTIHENFIRVKCVVKELIKLGVMEYHKNPFNDFKVEKKRVERLRLTMEQILLLEKAPVKTKNHEKARDMYMFSFYCAGVRFGDMCRIRKSNFKDGRLRYVMNKTGKQRNIKLMPQALKIMKKYDYSFGIGTDFNSISSHNAYFNKLLKDIAKDIEIPPISFHTSRHSFADYALNANIDIHTLKDLLGHATVQMTENYAKSFYQEKTDDAMDKLFK